MPRLAGTLALHPPSPRLRRDRLLAQVLEGEIYPPKAAPPATPRLRPSRDSANAQIAAGNIVANMIASCE